VAAGKGWLLDLFLFLELDHGYLVSIRVGVIVRIIVKVRVRARVRSEDHADEKGVYHTTMAAGKG
jgi:hypothetical protein